VLRERHFNYAGPCRVGPAFRPNNDDTTTGIIRVNLCWTLSRSTLSPYYEKDKVLLERVKHRFTRMIPGFSCHMKRDLIVYNCKPWGWGNRANLLEVFKVYKGMCLLPFHQFFRNSTVVTTRGHSAKIAKVGCHLDLRHYFFSNRVIDRRNPLPQTVTESCSVNSFKNGLDNMRSLKMGFFMD